MGYLNPGVFPRMFWKGPNIKGHLAGTKYAHGHFRQEQIARTFWCGPNAFMDILYKTKCPARGKIYMPHI